jgi:class I fructose-bisphosphate aldolase
LGLLEGLDRTEELLLSVRNCPLAGAILNYGVIRYFKRIAPASIVPIIARLDGNRSFLAGDWTKSSEWELLYDADACREAGASAAAVNLILGAPSEMASIKAVTRAAVSCHRAGIPLLVSAMTFGVKGNERYAFGARMAYELGADVVSVYGVRDATCLAEVSRWCPLPFYAQGAPAADGPADLGRWAQSCIAHGARGVVAGRSIWQSLDPPAVTRQLLAELYRQP